jgi:hypothetical protein
MGYTDTLRRQSFIENGKVTSIEKVGGLENIVELTVKDKQKKEHKFRYDCQIYPIEKHERVNVIHLPSNNMYRIDRYGAEIRRTVAYAELVGT